jgi:phosphoribosylanthranilate isomerase
MGEAGKSISSWLGSVSHSFFDDYCMLRPHIKVCGITSAADAEMALELGADYVGVILYAKSPRAVPLNRLSEIFAVVPEGKRVLVDVATPTEVLSEYRNLPFDHFQMHFDLDVAIATVAAWAGIVGRERLWLAPRIPPQEAYFPQIIMEFADTLLIDTYAKEAFGGTGKAGNWQRFIDWSTLYQHKQWILAGGLSPLNISAALEATQAALIDVNSGVESAPGVKDRAKLEQLMQAIGEWSERSSSSRPGND